MRPRCRIRHLGGLGIEQVLESNVELLHGCAGCVWCDFGAKTGELLAGVGGVLTAHRCGGLHGGLAGVFDFADRDPGAGELGELFHPVHLQLGFDRPLIPLRVELAGRRRDVYSVVCVGHDDGHHAHSAQRVPELRGAHGFRAAQTSPESQCGHNQLVYGGL